MKLVENTNLEEMDSTITNEESVEEATTRIVETLDEFEIPELLDSEGELTYKLEKTSDDFSRETEWIDYQIENYRKIFEKIRHSLIYERFDLVWPEELQDPKKQKDYLGKLKNFLYKKVEWQGDAALQINSAYNEIEEQTRVINLENKLKLSFGAIEGCISGIYNTRGTGTVEFNNRSYLNKPLSLTYMNLKEEEKKLHEIQSKIQQWMEQKESIKNKEEAEKNAIEELNKKEELPPIDVVKTITSIESLLVQVNEVLQQISKQYQEGLSKDIVNEDDGSIKNENKS